MTDKKLLEDLNRLGFSLFETTAGFDVNKTLAEVVRSRDMRLWEGFPVLMANAAREHDFDYASVLKHLTKKSERTDLHDLVVLALAVYKHFRLSFAWATHLRKRLPRKDQHRVIEFGRILSKDGVVAFGNKRFESSRLKTTFNNYFAQDAEKTKQLAVKYEELSLEFALSQLFSPRQKDIFLKRLGGEPLSKTEREYYSRTVKKKVSALANPELHRLAQRLMQH